MKHYYNLRNIRNITKELEVIFQSSCREIGLEDGIEEFEQKETGEAFCERDIGELGRELQE